MKRRLQLLHLIVFGLLFAAAGVFAQIPVANYPFTGSARDISAGGNDASVHGATLTQDRFGWANSAFLFDGTQAFLQAPNSAALNSNYTTVSFWIKATEIPAQSEVYLLSFGGWQERWKISLPNHGKIVWSTNNSSGGSDMDAGAANVLPTGVWKHVVFVHDGAKDIIYMNGVEAANKNVSGTLNSTTKPLGIGYNAVDGGNFFKGALDEVQVYNVALSAPQIAALYASQNTAPVVSPGLVASYAFSNNGSDGSTFGNHATLTDVKSTTDRFGYGNSAFSFNGTSSEVTASNSAQLNSDYTTVSFWIKPNSFAAPGSETYVLSFGGWQERWKISMPDHGKPVWTTNAQSCCSDLDSGDPLALGVWRHVVMVHNGTKDKIFFDGVLKNEKDSPGALKSTTYPLGIGYNGVDGGNWFDGVLDEVQIYNYALSDVEIAALYTVQSTFPGSATDLVADYSFAGDARDATQFGNDAVVNGATPTTDRFGYASNAYNFDGTSSIEAANSIQLNSNFATVSFWVKVDELAAPGSESYLLSYGGWQERWKISLPSHGKPVWTTNAATCCSDLDSGAGNELPIGVWKHVVMVHNGTKDKIFMNGVLVNEKDALGNLKSTKYPLGMGYNPIDGGNYFKGSLDDIQIYNLALSDVAVAALYAAQSVAPAITDELVANYTFAGNAEDKTPFHNNAQVNGAQLSNDRFNNANHAYSFNGAGDQITAANSPQLNSNLTSISFWIKPKSLPAPGSEVYLLSFGGWQQRWKVSLPSHGKPVFTTNALNCCSDLDSGDPLAIDVWRHVVMVHNGTKDKIFFDGVLKAEKDSPGNLKVTTSPLGIGYDAVDGGSFFNGALDEVQIYNVALSDSEVADLYAAQSQAPAVTDTEAPSAPLNLAATVSFNNVTLSWLPASDNVAVTGYNLYQDGNKIQTTAGTSSYLPGLPSLTQFTFGVSAVDAAGNESLISTLNVTTDEDETPDVTPPTQPGNLIATTGAHSVLLAWDASTDDRAVKGYVVFVDGVFFDSLAETATSVLVGGLDSETPYSFEIYAFDKAGNNSTVAELTVSTDQEIDTGEPGLVAWYPFEGNANDATPYNNHGVIGGNPVFEPAGHPNGGAQNIKFDGVGDSVLAPNAVQLISDYTTVGFWIRVDEVNLNDGEAYVLDFGHWTERWKISLPQHLKIAWTTNGNNVQFPVFISDMDSGGGNEMVVGFWWYVTMVHDGTNDIVYVNGEQVNIKPVPTKLNSTNNSFGMGSNPVEGGQYFHGALDEVKIYNKALTAAEIEHLFDTGTTGTQDLNAELLKRVKQIFPNPATDRVWVEHAFDNKQSLLVRVFDVQGRQVGDLRFAKNEVPAELFSVDVQTYPAGTYFLNFVVDGKDLGSMKFDKK